MTSSITIRPLTTAEQHYNRLDDAIHYALTYRNMRGRDDANYDASRQSVRRAIACMNLDLVRDERDFVMTMALRSRGLARIRPNGEITADVLLDMIASYC